MLRNSISCALTEGKILTTTGVCGWAGKVFDGGKTEVQDRKIEENALCYDPGNSGLESWCFGGKWCLTCRDRGLSHSNAAPMKSSGSQVSC